MAFPVIYDPQIFPPPDEGGGGGGSGTVTSIGATPPINVTPSPITTSGIVGHDPSGVAAASYGDSTHYIIATVNATGHITAMSAVALPSSSSGPILPMVLTFGR